jgi:Asp-tRNA(Asn)/Glu-tRNA(Gln) amidotransferase A subunit family amidase
VLADRARADADRVDEAIAAGRDPGPLAGMPFAAKNLFDIAGVTTLAGSRINAGRAPATRDAAAVAALRGAGAILIGALNMDEYAYGFTTIGLPVLSVPVRMGPLPLGVQIIGAPFGEAAMLRVGARLLAKGVAAAAVAP